MPKPIEPYVLTSEVLQTFPGFAAASEEILENILAAGKRMMVPARRVMCAQGEQCRGFPLVLRGRARVHTVGENGRDITLYRLLPGETCMLAISCVLSGRLSPAYTVSETAGEVMIIPGPIFCEWFTQDPFWREFVFTQMADCLVDVITVTNNAVFRPLDARISRYLLVAPNRTHAELRVTHQDIAAEIGSSREVVSRTLKALEKEGLLSLGRGLIRLEDRDGLAMRAQTA